MLNIELSVVCCPVLFHKQMLRVDCVFWEKARMVLLREQELNFSSQQCVFQVLKLLCLQRMCVLLSDQVHGHSQEAHCSPWRTCRGSNETVSPACVWLRVMVFSQWFNWNMPALLLPSACPLLFSWVVVAAENAMLLHSSRVIWFIYFRLSWYSLRTVWNCTFQTRLFPCEFWTMFRDLVLDITWTCPFTHVAHKEIFVRRVLIYSRYIIWFGWGMVFR